MGQWNVLLQCEHGEYNEVSGERKIRMNEPPISYTKPTKTNKFKKKNQSLDEKNKGEIIVQNMRICIWGEEGNGLGHHKKGK